MGCCCKKKCPVKVKILVPVTSHAELTKDLTKCLGEGVGKAVKSCLPGSEVALEIETILVSGE